MKKIVFTLSALFAVLCANAHDSIWVYKSDGTHIAYPISKFDSITFFDPTIPEKCKASDYPQVTIGTQVWMAENYRCSKYDTESEAYNASWLTDNTIPTSYSMVHTPYYTDASYKSNWESTEYAGNLTDVQVAKLGYLYNWAAAVGVENGYDYDTTPFTGTRQGICPNGWHVPTNAEWQTLYDYIYNAQSLTSNQVGKYLKTTSGWYNNGNGEDTYGFAALPAGSASGSSVGSVGGRANFWTATPAEGYSFAYNRYLNDGLNSYQDFKNYGQSVRCLSNKPSLSVTPQLKKISYNGEQFTLKIESSTNWSICADNSNITFDKTTGSKNDDVVVTVENIESIGTTSGRIFLRKEGCIIDGTPYLHYWTDDGKTTKWPGVKMKLIPDGKWWYYDVEYEDESFNIIFNDGNGSQTDDILDVSGNECFSVEDYYEAIKIDCDKDMSLITVTTTQGVTAQCEIQKEILSVTPTSKAFGTNGGTFDITVTSNTSWTASSSETWATLSSASGSGNGKVSVKVAPNTSAGTDTAVVTFATSNNKSATVQIERRIDSDICGNTYKTVTIGNQIWMAENLKCNKYDTQSEAYNATWLKNNTIPTNGIVLTPYYTDASDKSLWDEDIYYAGNLTDAQVAKLGYLYNWAAAVGVEDGEKQTTEFSGNRQGICPNGWHVPSNAEWQTLQDYIEVTQGKGYFTAGTHLKTTSGWYDEGKPAQYPQGLDTYGFAALPAGYSYGRRVYNVGFSTFFWTATLFGSGGNSALYRCIGYSNSSLYSTNSNKNSGRSVRCIRD